MTQHRWSSIVILSAIVLLAVFALALSNSGSDTADLVGAPTLLTADGESASGGGTAPPEDAERSKPTPLPSVNGGTPGGAGGEQQVEAQSLRVGGAPAQSVTGRLEAVPPGIPRSLSIPSLEIDSPIVPVGLEADGTMQIPGATEAGWYLPGRLPGAATGSAVIAAHVDYNEQPGVFIDLRRIEIGSEVAVTDADGSVHRFQVTERYQVDKDDLPVEELFRTGGAPLLTLVTCGGAFDRNGRSYSDNIVVRAEPIP